MNSASEAVSKSNPRNVVAVLLLWTAMALLVPGITGDLMHYRVNYNIDWLGRSLKIKEEVRSLMGFDQSSSIIGALYEHQAVWPARALMFFGAMIPLSKMLAFHAWMFAQPGTMAARIAGKFMGPIGGLAKWVACDAVVETMFIGSLLSLNSIQADHRFGYLCFIAYFILSSLAFVLVETDHDDYAEVGPAKRYIGKAVRKYPLVLVGSAMLFMFALYSGATSEVMRIYIPETVIRDAAAEEIKSMPLKHQSLQKIGEGPLKALEDHLIGEIAMKIRINERISIVQAAEILLTSGIPITVIGAAVVFGCVLLVPLLHVLVGTYGAFSIAAAKTVRAASQVLSHFVIIDVFCVGCICAVWTTKCEPEVKALLLPGFLNIMGAALLWFVHSALSDAAADAALAPEPKADVEAQEPMVQPQEPLL